MMLQIAKLAREHGMDARAYTTEMFLVANREPKMKEEHLYYFGSFYENMLHNYVGKTLGRNGCYSYFGTKQLIRALKKFDPDVVHLHNLHAHCFHLPLLFRFLSQSEMETNARYIWDYLGSRGWSKNAVAGMLGNMESESTINPGIWEGLNANVGPGYGLVQWTPYTKYTEWCADRGIDPSAMSSALQRIEYELDNGLQYDPTEYYQLSFAEFKVSTYSPEYLALAFLNNYERPADYNQPHRMTQARAWYDFLEGGPVSPDTPEQPVEYKGNHKKMPLMLLISTLRRRS